MKYLKALNKIMVNLIKFCISVSKNISTFKFRLHGYLF